MSFTRVSCSVKKERKTVDWFQTPNSRKNSKIMKRATKYKQQGICTSKGRMLKLNGKKH
jgi:hypothetical protein